MSTDKITKIYTIIGDSKVVNFCYKMSVKFGVIFSCCSKVIKPYFQTHFDTL